MDLVATTLKGSIKQIESDAGVKFIKMNRYPIANSIFVDGFDNYVILA